MYHTDDTIVAIASAPGGAARGIVRLSGRAVISILESCFVANGGQPLAEIRAATVLAGSIPLACLNGGTLAADLYLWPDNRSYTREPVAELHTVGSPPLLSALVDRVCATGARLAEPGEFTLRAFLAGRLDLTQAEAVLGVIDARGEGELRGALEQLAGGLARPLTALREALLDLLAQLEAGLDFVEEDIQFVTAAEVAAQLGRASAIIAQVTAQLSDRAASNTLARVTLVGWPNVGKSSLFNALAPHGAALVADAPGTTRDYLLASLDLGLVSCHLIDTAGVELDGHSDESHKVAQAAQQFTASEAARADVRVLCLDATRALNAWEREQLADDSGGSRLVVLTKCDMKSHASLPNSAIGTGAVGTGAINNSAVKTSAVSGLGLETLREALRQAISAVSRGDSAASLSAERCGESLRAAGHALARAAELNRAGGGEELIAAEIRQALTELGQVVGSVYTDDILDRIFSRFCIGK